MNLLDVEVSRVGMMDDDCGGRLLGIELEFLGEFDSDATRIEQLEQLRWFSLHHTVQVVMTEAAPHAGVDTHADLLRVRALWENEK